jgi:hypothetical protein
MNNCKKLIESIIWSFEHIQNKSIIYEHWEKQITQNMNETKKIKNVYGD